MCVSLFGSKIEWKTKWKTERKLKHISLVIKEEERARKRESKTRKNGTKFQSRARRRERKRQLAKTPTKDEDERIRWSFSLFSESLGLLALLAYGLKNFRLHVHDTTYYYTYCSRHSWTLVLTGRQWERKRRESDGRGGGEKRKRKSLHFKIINKRNARKISKFCCRLCSLCLTF